MSNILTAIKRSKTDKLATIRHNGMVPAVVYGASVENTTISVSSVLFEKVFKIAGETSAIILELEDVNEEKNSSSELGKVKNKKKIDVLIHDVQVDPIKGFPIHIDFLAIDINKPIEVQVPIEFVGIAQAEKDGLGVLVKVLHQFEVEALPKDIPHSIVVDVTSLAVLDAKIHVKDVTLPLGVKMLTEIDEVIALIAPMKEEKEEEATPVDLSAIEVEKKGKKEEEEAQPTEEKV